MTNEEYLVKQDKNRHIHVTHEPYTNSTRDTNTKVPSGGYYIHYRPLMWDSIGQVIRVELFIWLFRPEVFIGKCYKREVLPGQDAIT